MPSLLKNFVEITPAPTDIHGYDEDGVQWDFSPGERLWHARSPCGEIDTRFKARIAISAVKHIMEVMEGLELTGYIRCLGEIYA